MYIYRVENLANKVCFLTLFMTNQINFFSQLYLFILLTHIYIHIYAYIKRVNNSCIYINKEINKANFN